MECAKPPVPRHFLIAIITFVIAVVQLMIERAEREPSLVPDQQVLIARVGHGGTGALINDVEYQVDRVRGNNAMDGQRGQVEEVLHRVHGQTGPGTNIDVSVMQAVDVFVHERQMQKPVHPVKMQR